MTETIKDLYFFTHNLTFIYIFDIERQQAHFEKELTEWTKHFTMEEFKTFCDLMLLYEEGAIEDDLSLPPKLSWIHPFPFLLALPPPQQSP